MLIEQKIINLLKKLVNDLVDKNYDKIFEEKCNGELTVEEIERALFEYGGKLTIPPAEAYYTDALNIIEIKKNIEYHIEFDLWVNNKKSDLSLICNAIFDNSNIMQIIIKDINVL